MKSYCEQGSTVSGSVKCCEILEYRSDWVLLKNDSTPCRNLMIMKNTDVWDKYGGKLESGD